MAANLHPVSFLQQWLREVCNGEWEQTKGVTIESLSSPGWIVTVDLAESPLDGVPMDPVRAERSSSDWIDCRVELNQFIGSGDPSKLSTILHVFQTWATRSQKVK